MVPPEDAPRPGVDVSPAATGPTGAPLHAVLDIELQGFELYTVRLWQILSGIGILIGLYMAATLPGNVGLAIAGAAAGYFLYTFPMSYRITRHGKIPGWLEVVSTVVEASVPWTFMVVLTFAQGAEYALASWVPPTLFCMILFQNALRLRANAVFVVGITGAVAFLGLWFLVVRARLVGDTANHLLHAAPIQISRFVLLVLISIMCGFGARYLRAAIIRAEGIARSKDLFGKYRLLRTVARGGMGEVIEALYCPEGGFERRVAIKRIHEHLAGQPRFVEQFRTEAELCSRLAHPNVVQVLDFGRIQATYFLAMEYVDGMTLAQLLARSDRRQIALPEHVVGAVMRDVLAGLDHAHRIARGKDGQPLHIVHRDLCPQNVLLSEMGEVKISDFGVARALKNAGASNTRTVVGHTAYLAPEQARALPIDSRIDLFAAGVICWELLTGRRLFLRDGDAATVLALLEDPVPPVGTYREGLHVGWDAFLQRALAKSSDRRYQTAVEMLAGLDAIPTANAEGASRDLATLVATLRRETPAERDDPPTDTRGATKPLVDAQSA